VREAAELPGGGFTFDGKRLVAFYGNPTTSALGVLGEQDPAALERIGPLVEEYSADGLQGIPTFEIIATIASARAGADNDYSDEMSLEDLRPWIDFAGERGLRRLDLQPGRTDFLTQAKRYEEFLRLPHVGLALDPEWRLGPIRSISDRSGRSTPPRSTRCRNGWPTSSGKSVAPEVLPDPPVPVLDDHQP
jgi:hypothetical protein